MKRTTQLALAVTAAAGVVVGTAAPSQAYETYSFDNSFAKGNGRIWYDDNRHIGFSLSLTDDAADGSCVYFQVQGMRPAYSGGDTSWFRMTQDVCGSGNRGYFSDASWQVLASYQVSATGYRVRPCKNVSNAPDPCGELSRVTDKGTSTAG